MELLNYVKKYTLPTDLLELTVQLKYEEWVPHSWYTPSGNLYDDKDPLNNVVCYEDVEKYFFPVFRDLFRRYEIDCGVDSNLVVQISGVRLNQYREGEFMKLHHDHIHSAFQDAPPHSRGIPVLSVVGNVSTEPYTGGQFYLCNRDMHLDPGDAIIFPSSFMFPHEVKPVLSGVRTSFVTWAW